MTIPGFSAETALHERSGHYRMAASCVGGSGVRVDPAQFLLPDGGFCRPFCGPCRSMPEVGPGLWRFCLTPSCEERYVRCSPPPPPSPCPPGWRWTSGPRNCPTCCRDLGGGLAQCTQPLCVP
jgi:hypothetical protein